MPEAKETDRAAFEAADDLFQASQPGVPSSREYARRSPSTKFDAGHGGTFSGEPGRRSRPAETSHDPPNLDRPRCDPSYPSMSLLDFSGWNLPVRRGPSGKHDDGKAAADNT